MNNCTNFKPIEIYELNHVEIFIEQHMKFGVRNKYADIPPDAYEFSNCVNLIKKNCQWLKRLNELKKYSLEWQYLINNWLKLTSLLDKHEKYEITDIIDSIKRVSRNNRRNSI